MIKKKIILLSLIVILYADITINVLAKESELKISVDALLPENQVTTGVKYFDLMMHPSDEQVVSIKLTNHTTENVDLKIVYSNATTTSQGVIEYSKNNELKNVSPPEYLFTNIIDGPENVTLKSKESRNIDFTLKMPVKEFDGSILGGVEFIQKIEDASNNSALKSQRSYLIGFRLSETVEKLPIHLSLDQTVVGTKNYKNAILISLINQNANLIEGLLIHGTIHKKEDSTILLETNMEQVRIAPYSVLETAIFLDDTLLKIGDYEINLTVKNMSGYSQEWQQSFKVTAKDVELFEKNQDTSINSTQNSWIYLLYLGLIVGIFIIGILTWLNKEILIQKIKRLKVKK